MVITKICHKWWHNYYWYLKWEDKPIELKNKLFKGFHDRAIANNAHKKEMLWLQYSKWERMPYMWVISKDCEYNQRNDITNEENHVTYEAFMSEFTKTMLKWLKTA